MKNKEVRSNPAFAGQVALAVVEYIASVVVSEELPEGVSYHIPDAYHQRIGVMVSQVLQLRKK